MCFETPPKVFALFAKLFGIWRILEIRYSQLRIAGLIGCTSILVHHGFVYVWLHLSAYLFVRSHNSTAELVLVLFSIDTRNCFKSIYIFTVQLGKLFENIVFYVHPPVRF